MQSTTQPALPGSLHGATYYPTNAQNNVVPVALEQWQSQKPHEEPWNGIQASKHSNAAKAREARRSADSEPPQQLNNLECSKAKGTYFFSSISMMDDGCAK